jgi:hypothetical protein
MYNYNCICFFDHVVSSKFNTCILAQAGDKFKLSNGKTVQLAFNDIRFLEIVATFQLSFGALSQYRHKLMNVLGGGENGGKSQHDILYFRLGKKQEEKRENVVKHKKFYKAEIPRTEKGKVDWGELVPNWLIVFLCGGLLKKKKDASEYFFKCF